MIPPGVEASMENVHKILEELAAVWRNEQPNFAWLVEKSLWQHEPNINKEL